MSSFGRNDDLVGWEKRWAKATIKTNANAGRGSSPFDFGDFVGWEKRTSDSNGKHKSKDNMRGFFPIQLAQNLQQQEQRNDKCFVAGLRFTSHPSQVRDGWGTRGFLAGGRTTDNSKGKCGGSSLRSE